MKSLFAKVFFWFWLAMAVVVVVFVISFIGMAPKPPPHVTQLLVDQKLETVGQASLMILPQGGPDQLRRFLEQASPENRTHLYVFTEAYPGLSPDAAPERFRDLIQETTDDGTLRMMDLKNRFGFAKRVQNANGDSALVVLEVPRFPTPSEIAPRVLIPIAAVFLVGALLCYWLARSVTGPLRRMSEVATQLAEGRLDARVGRQATRRHDELGTLAREFDGMANRVESLLSGQQRLLRDVSHELRSPLTRLNLALELARQKSPAEVVDALDRIERESGRLNQLIGELLTFARIESESGQLGGYVDVEKLLRTIVEDAQFEAGSRRVSVQLAKSKPCVVLGHVNTLFKALENVVRNALRYTEQGTSVEISLDCSETDGHSEVIVCVRDHGPGVPEDDLANVLRPFYSADHSPSHNGGAGLGLAIADRVVRQLDGSIALSNALEGGLIVEIRLPGTATGSTS